MRLIVSLLQRKVSFLHNRHYATTRRFKIASEGQRSFSSKSTRTSHSVSSAQHLLQQESNPLLGVRDQGPRFCDNYNKGSPKNTNDADHSNPSEVITIDSQSPSELVYTGGATIPITSLLHIVSPQEDTPTGVWPIFRIMVSITEANIKSAVFKSF